MRGMTFTAVTRIRTDQLGRGHDVLLVGERMSGTAASYSLKWFMSGTSSSRYHCLCSCVKR